MTNNRDNPKTYLPSQLKELLTGFTFGVLTFISIGTVSSLVDLFFPSSYPHGPTNGMMFGFGLCLLAALRFLWIVINIICIKHLYRNIGEVSVHIIIGLIILYLTM